MATPKPYKPPVRAGQVRGLPGAVVRELFTGAVEAIPPGAAFSRADLRAALQAAAVEHTVRGKLDPEEALALEHAFWRTVAPLPGERAGAHVMPLRAPELVRHRDYRLPGGRLHLADVLQLVALLQQAEDRGVLLTPTLRAKLEQGGKALRALRLPTKGEADRAAS